MSNNKIFLIYWTSLFLLGMADSVVGFSLGIWIYEETRSVTYYALFPLLSLVPFFLLAPFQGVLADRFSIKLIIMVSFVGSVVFNIFVYFFTLVGTSAVWIMAIGECLGAIFGSAMAPALAVMTSEMIEKKSIGRASALLGMIGSFPVFLSPIIAGFMLSGMSISHVVLAAVAVQLFLCIVPAVMFFSPVVIEKRTPSESPLSFINDVRQALVYVRSKKGLLQFFWLIALVEFCMAMVETTGVPFLMEISSKSGMSILMSIAGIGMTLGGFVLVLFPKPSRRIFLILLFYIAIGIQVAIAGVYDKPVLIGFLCFGAYFLMSAIDAMTEAVFLLTIDTDVLGRVSSLLATAFQGMFIVCLLCIGPLVDHVMTPLGNIIFGESGTVPATRIFWILLGGIVILISLAGFKMRSLGFLEKESELIESGARKEAES